MKKTILIIIGAIIVVGLATGGVYLWYKNKLSKTIVIPQEQTTATEINGTSHAECSLNNPPKLYQDKKGYDINAKNYLDLCGKKTDYPAMEFADSGLILFNYSEKGKDPNGGLDINVLNGIRVISTKAPYAEKVLLKDNAFFPSDQPPYHNLDKDVYMWTSEATSAGSMFMFSSKTLDYVFASYNKGGFGGKIGMVIASSKSKEILDRGFNNTLEKSWVIADLSVLMNPQNRGDVATQEKIIKEPANLYADNFPQKLPLFSQSSNAITGGSYSLMGFFNFETNSFEFKVAHSECSNNNPPSVYKGTKPYGNNMYLQYGYFLDLCGKKTDYPAFRFEKEGYILYSESTVKNDNSGISSGNSLKTISLTSPYEEELIYINDVLGTGSAEAGIAYAIGENDTAPLSGYSIYDSQKDIYLWDSNFTAFPSTPTNKKLDNLFIFAPKTKKFINASRYTKNELGDQGWEQTEKNLMLTSSNNQGTYYVHFQKGSPIWSSNDQRGPKDENSTQALKEKDVLQRDLFWSETKNRFNYFNLNIDKITNDFPTKLSILPEYNQQSNSWDSGYFDFTKNDFVITKN